MGWHVRRLHGDMGDHVSTTFRTTVMIFVLPRSEFAFVGPTSSLDSSTGIKLLNVIGLINYTAICSELIFL